jgi:hypothetical protein
LAKCEAKLLPVPYFHVVFTLPHELSALVLGNRKLLYQLLFDSAKETLLEVAADPKHLGARIGVLMVLHTWGQKLEHHPHVHCVVPGGGLAVSSKTSATSASAPDDQTPCWVSCQPNWFLSVRVLSRLYRHLEGLCRWLSAQGDDARRGGIRASVRAAYHTQGVGADSALWTVGSSRSR